MLPTLHFSKIAVLFVSFFVVLSAIQLIKKFNEEIKLNSKVGDVHVLRKSSIVQFNRMPIKEQLNLITGGGEVERYR